MSFEHEDAGLHVAAQDENPTKAGFDCKTPLAITVRGVVKRDGKPFCRPVVFNFDVLKIRPGGLLEEAMRSIPSMEIAETELCYLRIVLDLCKEQAAIRALLSAPVRTLCTSDIHRLFTLVEELITHALVHTGRYKSGYAPSNAFQKFIRRIRSPLRDGNTLATMRGFKSRFKYSDGHPRLIISDLEDPGERDLRYAGPVEAIPIVNDLSPDAAVLDHLQHRNQRIIEACWQDIRYALKWRDRIQQLKATPLPEAVLNGASSAWDVRRRKDNHFKNLSPYNLLHLYVQMVKEAELHVFGNFQRLLAALKGSSEPHIFRHCGKVFDAYPKISRVASNRTFIAFLLSDYYLPNRAILAIRNLFQMRFMWNLETANDLSRQCLQQTPDGYELIPFKSRSGQFQPTHVGKDEQDILSLIKLLLINDQNITQYWQRDSDSFFVGWQSKEHWPRMGRFDTKYQLQAFINDHRLAPFTFEQLRNQAANTDYLIYKDVHRTQSLMGHGSLGQTGQYIDQTINHTLSAVNMRQFMQRLAPSIVWAVGGDEALAKCGLVKSDVDTKLLFPVADVTTRNNPIHAVVDEWFEDAATPIVLTRDRIAFTVRQWRYYCGQWQRLYNDNPERFLKVHLPRMIFAKALCRIIEETPYVALYDELKRKLAAEE